MCTPLKKKKKKTRKGECEKKLKGSKCALLKILTILHSHWDDPDTDSLRPLWQSLGPAFVLGGKTREMTQRSPENMAIKHPLFSLVESLHAE